MQDPSFPVLINEARHGNHVAHNRIYERSFSRLRAIAWGLLARERRGHTLQPTALVNELFLKLHRLQVAIQGEDHFFAICARAMKQILVDHARAKSRSKRVRRETVSELLAASSRDHCDPVLRITVKIALEELQALDPKAAATVWLRTVEGMTTEEISRRQGRELWRVRADHDYGLQWMSDRLTNQTGATLMRAPSPGAPTKAGDRQAGSGDRDHKPAKGIP